MIRLINYPYGKYKVGDEVDLGDEKNQSMVALGRAVFVGDDAEKWNPVVVAPPIPKPTKPEVSSSDESNVQSVTNEVTDDKPIQGSPAPKKIVHKLKLKIQEETKSRGPKSFWDRLR